MRGQVVEFTLTSDGSVVGMVVGPYPSADAPADGADADADADADARRLDVPTAAEVAASLVDTPVVVGVGTGDDRRRYGTVLAQGRSDGTLTNPTLSASYADELGFPYDEFVAWLSSGDVDRVGAELEAVTSELAEDAAGNGPFAQVLEESARCGRALASLG